MFGDTYTRAAVKDVIDQIRARQQQFSVEWRDNEALLFLVDDGMRSHLSFSLAADERTPSIIQQVVGASLVPGKVYPGALPADIAPWICYTVDGGYSLLVVVKRLLGQAQPANRIEDYFVPAPVRTVLRVGYVLTDEGYPISDLEYDDDLGLIVPEGDDEY